MKLRLVLPLTLSAVAMAQQAVLVGPTKLGAPSNEWTDLGPEGGRVLSVVIDPQNSGVVYASTPVGLFKSHDHGTNWTKIGLMGYIVGEVIIDAHDSNTIYVETAGHNDQDTFQIQLFKSTDGGATWSELDSGRSDFCCGGFVIDAFNRNTVYVGTLGGILKSTDGGSSWKNSSTGLPSNLIANALALDSQHPGVLYVAGVLQGTHDSGVFKTVDGAATWAEADAGLTLSPNVGINGLTLDQTRPEILYLVAGRGQVFKSTDGASSWTESEAGIRPDSILGAVVVDPSALDTLFMTGWGGGDYEIYKSADGGTNWTSSILPSYPYGIAIDPRNSSTLYLAGDGGAFMSLDGGASWTASKWGLRAVPVISVAMEQGNPRTIYVGTDQGLFKSTDAGSDWHVASAGITSGYPADSIVGLAVDPRNPANMFAATSGVECGYGAGGVFRSTDGSASWTDTGVVSCMYGLALDPQTPSTVYAATAYSGILKSTDGAQTWTPRNSGLLPSTFPGPQVTAVGLDPQRPTTLFAGITVWDGQAHGGLFKSVDGAMTWLPTRLQTNGIPISSVVVDSRNSNTVYAAIGREGSSSGALWKSTDGGTNWRNLIASMPVSVYAVVIDPRDSMNVFAATDAGVMKSTDGGESWTLVPGSPAFSRVLALDSQDVGILYAGGLGGLFSTTFCRDRRGTLSNVTSVQPAERADPRRPAGCPDQR